MKAAAYGVRHLLLSVVLAGPSCVDAGLPAEWPLENYEAAFFVGLAEDGMPVSIEGPLAGDPRPSSPFGATRREGERLLLVAFDETTLRALPGGYTNSLAGTLRLVPEAEPCPAPGRLLDAEGRPGTRLALPSTTLILELDLETGQFFEPDLRAPIDGWSLEFVAETWCEARGDVALEPFELSAPYPLNTNFHTVIRLDDDRLVLGTGDGIFLAERGEPASDEAGRAVLVQKRKAEDTFLYRLVHDPVRSTPARHVFIGAVLWDVRSQGALLEVVLDETGLHETRWTELSSGPVWSAIIQPDGRLFAVGGRNVDPIDLRSPPEGMVLTASTSAGPFEIQTLPGVPTRTLTRSPDPQAPHWVGTMSGVILEGDLALGFDSLRPTVPESGALYAMVGLGTSEPDVVGLALTSIPVLLERRGGVWRRAVPPALPPRARDCEAVASPDECGQHRWSRPRTDEAKWSPWRPWEARFTPVCDAIFLWDEREGCMSVAAPDLERVNGGGRLLSTDLDRDGRRLTVAGTDGRIFEAWLAPP